MQSHLDMWNSPFLWLSEVICKFLFHLQMFTKLLEKCNSIYFCKMRLFVVLQIFKQPALTLQGFSLFKTVLRQMLCSFWGVYIAEICLQNSLSIDNPPFFDLEFILSPLLSVLAEKVPTFVFFLLIHFATAYLGQRREDERGIFYNPSISFSNCILKSLLGFLHI